ncbi:MAG TPA: choice-of-anchor tandem repeat GloVer-containing protein [Rhizomicrobium sp.]|jgi:uncharacterized repeat protein (TIGR03803 family)|nr:choice-of-anchor tandem repeat GloVer-containing protein [Rhizomicrobium sp.]
MFRISGISRSSLFGCTLAVAAFAPCTSVNAAEFKLLCSFQGGSDGGNPYSALVPDGRGGFYGTTAGGGGTGCGGEGCGTIYDVTPEGTETVAYAFAGGADGGAPYANLTPQKDGTFLGTTSADGRYSGGVIFTFTPPGAETMLFSLGKGIRGWNSESAVISDKAGNLYGTTLHGGAENDGTVFTLAADGTYRTLHEFRGTDDGASPNGPLIRDKMGNLYGTTWAGCGVLFKIARNGTETVLHAFEGDGDACTPYDGLIEDAQGNFYGTTEDGGTESDGTVFKVAPDGTETILHSFQGGIDGWSPSAGLIADKAGNLYGTTALGGGTGCEYGYGCGTVFKISPAGKEKLLHVFQGSDGSWPRGTLVADKKGNLYGTVSEGGTGSCYNGCGTVFMVKE